MRSARHRLSLFLASLWHAEASGVAFHNGHLIPELVGTEPEMFILCRPTGLTDRWADDKRRQRRPPRRNCMKESPSL